MKLADELGFNTAWFVEHHFREGRSHCPAPEVVLGALTQATENIRLGFGVTLLPFGFTHPARVAEKVATADILSQGSRRVGHRPLDADGADRVPRRPRGEPRRVGGGDRDHLRDVARGVLRVGQPDVPVPASAWSRRSRSRIRTRRAGWRRRRTDSSAVAGRNQLGLLSFSIMQPLEKMAAQIARYREAQPRRQADHRRRDQQGRGLHARALRRDAGSRRATTASGSRSAGGTRTSPSSRSTGSSRTSSPRQREAAFPLLKPLMEGNIPIEHFDEADMIVVGDPERCFEKMKHYADLGVDELICYVQFGYHSGDESRSRPSSSSARRSCPSSRSTRPSTSAPTSRSSSTESTPTSDRGRMST